MEDPEQKVAPRDPPSGIYLSFYVVKIRLAGK
jgi:hypothetical protein